MHNLLMILLALLPWMMFVIFILLCIKLTSWAKKRRSGAIAIGLLVQMLLPDPRAQQTIEAIVERKQEVKKQQDEKGDPLDRNNKHQPREK
ncbi:hypothetical protein [Paraglaciecola hydrolytica]|uniref:Uncharacterized protein n=1 Tax=Paraglaciecola hydrolytica TaxID=1799789 RepID=A0A148KL12_9ALTE|nr:hypothetical protein [Paraglaciecola hydrolytica]KXI26938.1 hypothetical protein AX660_02205 [Paraglaciecola hydrolytica]